MLAIIAVAAALLTIRAEKHTSPTPNASEGSGNAAVGANGETSIITYSDTGFDPKNLSITPGTTITWSNESSHSLWVEGTGPKGGDCTASAASGTLNECASIGNGGSYSYTFTTPGSYAYMNHEQSNDTGIVTVTGDAPAAGAINPAARPE